MGIIQFIAKIALKLREKFFPPIESPQALRAWAGIFSLSNIVSCVFFFCWHWEWIKNAWAISLPVASAALHLLIGARFLSNSQKFGRIAFSKWAWLNLICISPIGLVLFYYVFNAKYWVLDEVNQNNELLAKKLLEERREAIPSKFKKLESKFNQSVAHLRKINPVVADQMFHKILGISNKSFSELSFVQISVVIALSTMCKQSKQKTFDNLVWGAHWFENHFFTFGFKNPKPISMYNKYPLIVGAIVLDELNNYRKILEVKMLIKKNLSFSDAKMISLHMGGEYKVFINQ